MRTLTLVLLLLLLLAECCVADDLRVQGFEGKVARLAQLAASGATPDDRDRAREQLKEILGDNRDMAPHVIAVLTADEDMVRRKAADAIVANGVGSLPLMPTIILVEDSRWTYKEHNPYSEKMRELLRQLSVPPAALVELCGHEHEETRQWALRVLSDFGPTAQATVPKLIGMLSEPRQDKWTRKAVLNVIRSIGPEAEPALPAVIKQLCDGGVDEAPCEALKAIGKPSVESLARLLSSSTPSMRISAAGALSFIGEAAKTSLPDLRKALLDKEVSVRVAAAYAVLRVGGEPDEAAVVLGEALSDRSVVHRAAWSLYQFGPAASPATKAMVEALKAEDAGVEARNWLLMTLAEVGSEAKSAAPLLTEMAREGPLELRESAAFAVWRVTGDARVAISSLTSLLEMELLGDQKSGPTSAASTLGRMGPAAAPAIPLLVKKMKRGGTSGFWALRALEKIGVAALPELRSAAQSEDNRIRRWAESAIARIEKESQNR